MQKELDFGVFFFHQVSMLQPIGIQDSMQTKTSRRIRGMERLRTLNSYQIFKIKN